MTWITHRPHFATPDGLQGFLNWELGDRYTLYPYVVITSDCHLHDYVRPSRPERIDGKVWTLIGESVICLEEPHVVVNYVTCCLCLTIVCLWHLRSGGLIPTTNNFQVLTKSAPRHLRAWCSLQKERV